MLSIIRVFFNSSWDYKGSQLQFGSELAKLYKQRKDANNTFFEMRNSLPTRDYCYRTSLNYRLEFDYIFSLIQPSINKRFLDESEKTKIMDAVFIMIQNGISLNNEEKNEFITNSTGIKQRLSYLPNFEKYLIYLVLN